MKIYSLFLLESPTLMVTSFLLTWWFHLIIGVIAAISAFIYHRLKIKAVKNEKAEMERKMLEKSELLVYSKGTEKKATEEADMANRSKSVLLSKITHEIRTPMNAMMGMASLLNETCLNPEQREFATSILQSGDGLLSLINDILMQDLLEYSKVDACKELERKEFDLRTSIEEVLDVFASKSASTGIDLVCNIHNKVPIDLVGDSYRIRQILMNLVENSFRFTSEGEITIDVSLLSTSEDNRINLQFEVKDSGAGMSKERLEAVSKDLLRADTINTKHETIGLTLIICKKLVGLMGGTLTVESRGIEGTVFKFNILVQPGLQLKRSDLRIDMASAKGKKVLIVDDNTSVSNSIKNQLITWNLNAHTVSSGRQALAFLENSPDVDLVITDLQMPELDGVLLTKSIKKQYPSLPVILLNNKGDESFRQYPELFVGQIYKPIKQHLLSKQISTALKQKSNGVVNDKAKQQHKLSVEFAKQYPMRILVGEDDAMNQHMIKMVLKRLGYEINICNNGKEVLEEVSNHAYDVILMDVQMPEMDGLEATKMIRLCLTNQPVIIAMTANTLQGDREMCLLAGMDDYISKPVKLEEIVDLLEKWSLQVRQYHNN